MSSLSQVLVCRGALTFHPEVPLQRRRCPGVLISVGAECSLPSVQDQEEAIGVETLLKLLSIGSSWGCDHGPTAQDWRECCVCRRGSAISTALRKQNSRMFHNHHSLICELSLRCNHKSRDQQTGDLSPDTNLNGRLFSQVQLTDRSPVRGCLLKRQVSWVHGHEHAHLIV